MRNAAVSHPTVLPDSIWGWRELLGLCKLKVVGVMLVCTSVGMALSTEGIPPLTNTIFGLIGIGLSACAAAAFNHVIDRHLDAAMSRTAKRPLVTKRLPVGGALAWAFLLSVIGLGVLVWQVNYLVALLTFASLIVYAVVYTAFLKRATPQNIVIGGVAGAAPPLLGWVSITGQITAEPLLLMLIIFAWTPPHFWALAIHKFDDYKNAGIPMLPVTHGLPFTRLQIWLYGWLTVAVSLLPIAIGMVGVVYFLAVGLLNSRFMYWNWKVWRGGDEQAPIQAFWFSVRYLLGLFGALLLDHYASMLS